MLLHTFDQCPVLLFALPQIFNHFFTFGNINDGAADRGFFALQQFNGNTFQAAPEKVSAILSQPELTGYLFAASRNA